jgi:hypothetical protein
MVFCLAKLAPVENGGKYRIRSGFSLKLCLPSQQIYKIHSTIIPIFLLQFL